MAVNGKALANNIIIHSLNRNNMKTLSVTLFCISAFFATGWQLDFNQAKQTAQTEHKYILVNFSGSDWCGPCIRLRKEIFESETFKGFANDHLVLVNADFPRSKRNALSKDQQKKNDALADEYNPTGIFPYTLLLNSDGKVVKSWEGYPGITAEEFTKTIESLTHAGN